MTSFTERKVTFHRLNSLEATAICVRATRSAKRKKSSYFLLRTWHKTRNVPQLLIPMSDKSK